MIYRTFKDKKISALGFGSMRLPVVEKNDALVDEEKAAEMVDEAIRGGINYFDTAWGYHSGNSELVMGKLLSKYPRESFFLATKFPGYDLSNMDKVESIFEKQLEKCRVDYFDFYLFHNVCEMNIEQYLDERFGIFDYLIRQKKNGRIRHLGFSVHGNLETMSRFLEKYGESMEFCQIQLNYIDYDFQDAKAKLDLLSKYNIPVWVMEPLRGGKLAVLKENHVEKFKAHFTDKSPVDAAFEFLLSFPQVTTILSGMSSLEQLRDNLRIFEKERPFTEEDKSFMLSLARDMLGELTLPCTGCHYCVSHCPKELDIPLLLSLYNEHCFTGGGFVAPMFFMRYPKEKHPSACLGCRSCEKVCPQQIEISKALSDFSKKLGEKK